MFNPKLIAIAAVCGFVLSFITGLFAGVNFGILLLRGILSAAVSGGVTAGVFVLYKKFIEQSSDSFSSAGESVPPPGSVVDITLGDDALQDDDAGPGFYVDPLVQRKAETLSSMKDKPSEMENVESFSNTAEESRNRTEPENSVTNEGLEAKRAVPDAAAAVQQKSAEKGSLDDELDDLPDIAALSKEITSSDDTYESPAGKAKVHVENNTQDANLMAQAIRTILTKDS